MVMSRTAYNFLYTGPSYLCNLRTEGVFLSLRSWIWIIPFSPSLSPVIEIHHVFGLLLYQGIVSEFTNTVESQICVMEYVP